MDYIELAKLGLFLFFSLAAMANKTPEEITAMLEEERKKFNENKPETLPDV